MKGLIAKFDKPEALVEALDRLQQRGLTRIDIHTPFPIPGVLERINAPTARIGWIAALAGLAGGFLTWLTVYWTSVVDYPLNIGGRPLHSWPAFLPVIIVAAALWSGIATLLAMLYWCGLPRWHHPLFSVADFDRATYDKFFLTVDCDDPEFDAPEVRRLLEVAGAERVEEVEL